MEKIRMTTPLVEMDGDEMTRILWKAIKDELICPLLVWPDEYKEELPYFYHEYGGTKAGNKQAQHYWDYDF